jgi:hypothetical protein
VAQVAQFVLDRTEGLVVGQVDQTLGHAIGDGVGDRVELGAEGLEAFFTPFGGLRRSGNGGV